MRAGVMKASRFTLLLAATSAAFISLGPSGAQRAPTLPPQIAAHVPRDIKPYFVAFLVSAGDAKAMSFDLFVRHQAYIRRQTETGVYRLAGPMTDGGRIGGMIILSADSAERARAIVEGDPSVQAKVFAVEVHSAMFPNLASLKVEYPLKMPR
jgi:uncharacterized protein YciI